MFTPFSSAQAPKPEAQDPFRLSFFPLLGLFFKVTTYFSFGTTLACVYFLFKAPQFVDDIPLLREIGSIYYVNDTRPLTKDWVEKRKTIFSQEGARLSVSDLDLNSWAAQAFPPGPLHLLPKFKDKHLNTLQSLLTLKRSSAPRFCIKPEGVYWSQALMLKIGSNVELPVFAQVFLKPQKEGGAISFRPESLSFGWLKIPLDRLQALPLGSLSLAYFYPSNRELANLDYLLKHLIDLRLDNRQLLLLRKGSAPTHKG